MLGPQKFEGPAMVKSEDEEISSVQKSCTQQAKKRAQVYIFVISIPLAL